MEEVIKQLAIWRLRELERGVWWVGGGEYQLCDLNNATHLHTGFAYRETIPTHSALLASLGFHLR
ncbi:hypothetical protein J6590_067266 [Homalodisca vitripennis]|nr:hypothetical protein J6590_067266 [Homalodisca vitripennis]